ncbi:stage II sporulation protein P [Acetivibrio saccincola]|jgi:stage II sporulation protein P|uniref:Stage II sporulation protein P n=1 Tax=Acetivibrio saccincola TaxID=1677857 RepID=A0A2S8RE22_9FIRM|nr:stage II sporulation protein P [Acetivibrio saccincola]NLW27555.1 stage II sporulation protein P [Acetivibrio saccincola]PQQ68033.1 stage II sporulation protein P [Acetivibrio saccincola]HOA97370.1 stage II sporulation protein P [Acetivibrio saccincola]HQD27713.1 stage II sporulation protein P [Acetivibrio saccincola]
MAEKAKIRLGTLSVVKKSILLFIAFLLAIKTGIIFGDFFYNSENEIIERVDVETFRSTLNITLPVIETIYNSGSISLSFSGQLRSIIKTIFHFDLGYPITVLNAQSPYFHSFYINGYNAYLNQGETYEPYVYIADLDIDENERENDFPNIESSITYNSEEDENDNKGDSEKNAVTIGDIAINNYETDFHIDVEKIMETPLKLNSHKKGPKVLIYHTHTTESFITELEQLEQSGIPNRTTDATNNVVRVGEELAQILRKKYNIEVIHNSTVHNYPSDTGAYGRSLNTASNILTSYPSIQIVIDIHRDGMDGKKLRTVTEIDGKKAAKIMFVVGTNATGLEHPEWRENLKLAITLQSMLDERYPGLTRPIYISKNRYNQHLSKGALIVEIGGDGNLISECLESTKYLAEVINEVLN